MKSVRAQCSVLPLIYAALQLSSLLSATSLKTALGPAASRILTVCLFSPGWAPLLCSTDLSSFLSCPGLAAKENISIHLWECRLQSPSCYRQPQFLELHLQFIARILSAAVVTVILHAPTMHLSCCHPVQPTPPPTHGADDEENCTKLLHILFCTSNRNEIAERGVTCSYHAGLGMLVWFTVNRNTAFPCKIINEVPTINCVSHSVKWCGNLVLPVKNEPFLCILHLTHLIIQMVVGEVIIKETVIENIDFGMCYIE